MKKQKILALLSAVVLVIGFTACDGEERITLPPHDNWTAEELSQALYIDGKNVGFPCTVDDFGAEYIFDDEAKMYYDEANNCTDINLYNKDMLYSIVTVADVKPEDMDKSSMINGFVIENRKCGNNKIDVSINGVGFGDTREEVIEAMGTPTKELGNSSVYKYNDGEFSTTIMFYFNDKNKAEIITIGYVPAINMRSGTHFKNAENLITDWSLEDLAEDITANGKKISIPCTVKELGGEYSVRRRIDNVKEGDGYEVMELYYNDGYFADVWIDTTESLGAEDDYRIIGIASLGGDLKIGDISFESTKEQVEAKYGKSNEMEEFDSVATYMFPTEDGKKLNCLLVTYDRENGYKVNSMKICFYDGGRNIAD